MWPDQVCICVLVQSVFSGLFLYVDYFDRGMFEKVLKYEKHRNIEIYCSDFSHSVPCRPILYSTKHNEKQPTYLCFSRAELWTLFAIGFKFTYFMSFMWKPALSQSMHHSKDQRPSDSQNSFSKTTHIKSQTMSVSHWEKVWVDKAYACYL